MCRIPAGRTSAGMKGSYQSKAYEHRYSKDEMKRMKDGFDVESK